MTSLRALACPQCGGPLPKAARWRMVECPHCRAVVTLAGDVVERSAFRAAAERARQGVAVGGRSALTAGGVAYALVGRLGEGTTSTVHLGERLGAFAARVVVKLGRDAGVDTARAFEHEAAALRAITALAGAAAVRLPQVLHAGMAVLAGGESRPVLVTRHVDGVWGDLAAVHAARPEGLDPRHAVWLWRRAAQALDVAHRAGWTHGDVAPEHLLVHPQAHAVFVCGWTHASAPGGAAFAERRAADLHRLAWCIRALVQGRDAGTAATPANLPAPFTALLDEAAGTAPSRRLGDAAALDRALVETAAAAFGAPRFVDFDPERPHGLGSR